MSSSSDSKEVFVIQCEATINYYEGEPKNLDIPYTETGILSVCSTKNKAKEHIFRYAKAMLDHFEAEGKTCKIDYGDCSGWVIDIIVSLKSPKNVTYNNIFTLGCLNYTVDEFEKLDEMI